MNTINKCVMNLNCKRHNKFAFSFLIFSPIKYGLRFFPISEIRVRNMRKCYPRQGRKLIYIIFYRSRKMWSSPATWLIFWGSDFPAWLMISFLSTVRRRVQADRSWWKKECYMQFTGIQE